MTNHLYARHDFGIVGVENTTITMFNDDHDMMEVVDRCAKQDNAAVGNIWRNSRNVALSRLRGEDAARFFPVNDAENQAQCDLEEYSNKVNIMIKVK